MAVPRPLDEQFADDYSQRASLRPSTGQISRTQNVRMQSRTDAERRQSTRAMRTTVRTASTAGQVAGAGMQVTGKTAKVAGRGMMRAGAALSGTGIGAVAGVPLAIAGGATTAAGTGLDAAGKQTRKFAKGGKKTSHTIERTTRRQYTRGKVLMRRLPGKVANLEDRSKVSAVNMSIFSWGIPLWLTFQLPLAVIHIAVFGLAMVEEAFTGFAEQRDEDGVLISAAKGTLRLFGKIIEVAVDTLDALTGIDLKAILGAFSPSNIAILMTTIMLLYGATVLLAIGFRYLFSSVKPFSGDGATSKICAFLLCLFGYIVPIFNLFPWFVFWCAAVWRYPK